MWYLPKSSGNSVNIHFHLFGSQLRLERTDICGNITYYKWPSLAECLLATSLQSCPTVFDPIDCRVRCLCPWFSRQEYWSGLPCPSPGDLPSPVIEPMSFMSPALASEFFTTSTTWEALLSKEGFKN